MPFKIHLIIVSIIILIVTLIWGLTQNATQPVVAAEPKGIIRKISVTHASYALNCRNVAINNAAVPQNAFSSASASIKEDNVLQAVSKLCNGKTECDVSADSAEFGEDPAPDCTPKALEIEYRCFSYDRPWIVKTSGGSVKLLCAKPKETITP